MANQHDERPRRTDGGSNDGEPLETEAPPVALNHIGHTVPDIEAAVEWYEEVLGFTTLAPPATVEAGSGHFADLFADIVGEFDVAKIAHMETADGTGFELFEYESTDGENARAQHGSENWQDPPGIHHFAVRHPDVAGLAERIVEHGGSQQSDVWRIFPDQEHELVYTKDPWGNFIEIYNRSYTQFFANQE